MEKGTLITAFVLVIFCFIIFILLIKKNKKEKKILSVLFLFARQSNYLITNFDVWSNSAIAIDKEKNVLFFIRDSDISAEPKIIQINNRMVCQLINEKSDKSTEEYNFRRTIKLGLLFKNPEIKSDTWMEFFNEEEDGHNVKGEIQLCEKWYELINEKIKTV